MKIDPNDYAFPSHIEGYHPERGMTKREHVQLELMKAITSNQEISGGWSWAEIATQAGYAAEEYFAALDAKEETK